MKSFEHGQGKILSFFKINNFNFKSLFIVKRQFSFKHFDLQESHI